MDKEKTDGVPTTLNRGIGYSQDNLRGVIWAARNGGGTGNPYQDAVNYALGEGNEYEDNPALRALRTRHGEYDLIINDATDPFGHTAGLFTKEFYGLCYKALKDDGVMVYQHGSPFYDEDEGACQSMHKKAYRVFPICRVYQAHIPTCPAGYWLFGFASKKYHPLRDFDAKRWKKRGIETWYYTTNLHTGAFMLPKYVEDLMEDAEERKK